MSSTSPAPTEPSGGARRRPVRRFVVLLAIAWAAAIGAAVLWAGPLHPPSKKPAPGPVIGEPGSPIPPGLIPPGAGSAGEVKPAPAPAFSLPVLSPGASSPAAGRAAPHVLIPAAGERLTLAALRGHPVVVNFWGSWCAPCRAEIPLLVKAWHAYAGRGVVVLGVDVDDAPAEARRFLQEYGVDYPVVTVPDDRLPRAYGVIGLPTTVFVDASGMIRARQIGGFVGEDGARMLTRRLDVLLGGAR